MVREPAITVWDRTTYCLEGQSYTNEVSAIFATDRLVRSLRSNPPAIKYLWEKILKRFQLDNAGGTSDRGFLVDFQSK